MLSVLCRQLEHEKIAKEDGKEEKKSGEETEEKNKEKEEEEEKKEVEEREEEGAEEGDKNKKPTDAMGRSAVQGLSLLVFVFLLIS